MAAWRNRHRRKLIRASANFIRTYFSLHGRQAPRQAPVESLGHLPASPDRGSRDWLTSALHRFRSAPGSRARAGACACRRACTMAADDCRGDGRGAAHGGGQATAKSLCGARHAASRFAALVWKDAERRRRLCPMPRGAAGRSEVSASRTWAKANPSLAAMPDLLAAIKREAEHARRDPSLLASFEALRLNLGTSDVEVSALLAASTWMGIEGEAGRAGACTLGDRPWHECSAIGRRCILAGNWPVGSSGGVPV